MPETIKVLLSHLEREYYDGVSTDTLEQRVRSITDEVLKLDQTDALRQIVEQNAPELWGADDPSPITTDAVQSALTGADGAVHLRAWANFWKVVATYRDVA